MTYETVAEASLALGVSKKTIYWAVTYGNPDKLGLGRPRPHRPRDPRLDASKPVRVGGVYFPSISALARFLGRDISVTRRALLGQGRAYERLVEAVRSKSWP